MLQPELEQTISRRRGRAIKTILRAAERDLFDHVDDDVAEAFRKVVYEELNDLTALVFDVLKTVEGSGGVLNGAYLDMIAEIHTHITAER